MGSSDRKTKKAAKKSKQLGKAALRSILKNEEMAASFLQALRAGRVPENFMMGKVTRALGGARFVVEVNGMEMRAALAGIITGRGGFFRNPEASTAVRAGSYVVIEDLGLGPYSAGDTHQIVAVLDAGQAAEARRLARVWSASSESSLGSGFTFDSDDLIERAGEIRETQIAEVTRTMAGLRPGGAAAAAVAAQAASAAADQAVAAANVAHQAAAAAAEYASSSSSGNGKTAAQRKHIERSRRRKAAKKAAAAGGGGK
jgi:hypothetical protein